MRLSAPIFQLKRRARQLARQQGLPLHEALDRLAVGEGFRSWSHLSRTMAGRHPGHDILKELVPGDLVLLGARPGQGKTLLGLELAVEATREGRLGYFFTLGDSEAEVLTRLRGMDVDPVSLDGRFILDTSDDICAGYVIERVGASRAGAVVVIDYLQLLDQKRRNPELAEQVGALKTYAASSGTIVVVISQISRTFDLRPKPLPELADVRLPNPLDLALFSKACFLHEGQIRLEASA